MKTKLLFLLLPFFLLTRCAQESSNKATEAVRPVDSTSQKLPATSKKNTPTTEAEQPVNSTSQKLPVTKKYGIKYTLPADWKTTTQEFKATDLKGNIVSIQTSYQDNHDQSAINLTFHPGEKGKKIYAYKLKNMGKHTKRIKIGSKEAIQTTELLKIDGKGHPLKQPTKRISVSLLTEKGEMDLVLNAKSQASEETFNDFISKIEF